MQRVTHGAIRNTQYTIRTTRDAFTFIELLIVIIIIGILSVLAVPRLKTTFDNLALESFIKDIYYLAHYLQTSAAGEARTYCLRLNREAGEIQAACQGEDGFGNIGGRFGKVYKAPAGVSLSLEPAQNSDIYFYPDASIDNIVITAENQRKKKVQLIIKGASGGIQIK